MDPLNDMRNALVSIRNILQRRKETNSTEFIPVVNEKELRKDSSRVFDMKTGVLQTPTISSFESTIVRRENENSSLHCDLLTQENFHRTHLCHRSIDELPNSNTDDIQRLKLTEIYTIQDLIGRYLIHDTPDEFYTFLMKNCQLSEKTASTVTQLLEQWTKCHLDGITG